MYHCGMRQVGERHVAYQVDLMVWSNRLDLLAISNFKGMHDYCILRCSTGLNEYLKIKLTFLSLFCGVNGTT